MGNFCPLRAVLRCFEKSDWRRSHQPNLPHFNDPGAPLARVVDGPSGVFGVAMKITQTGFTRSTPLRRRDHACSGKSTEFTKHLTASDTETAVVHIGGASRATSVESLLAIQEVGDATENAKEARERGERILDRLDEIRHELLMGTLSPAKLDDLGRMVKRQRATIEDPRVREVLDEIELRAAVELAKYSVGG